MIEQVGRYKILGQIGKGGMGVVFLAEDPVLDRRVAIKTLDLALADSDRKGFLRSSLLKDARAAAGLSHPHIVSVYDVLEEGDAAYLVLEYVAGQSLAQRLAAPPAPDSAFILRVLREMASALDYTHARGIVHRDIKPANVLLDADGVSKITDFGIARINDNRTRTATGTMMGTIEYMAPEQVAGREVDGRADQVSLAVVAFEMLTGKTLFGDHSFTTLAYKIVHEVPPAARSHNPRLPQGVDDVLARAFRKQPEERFATCGEFVGALERAFADPVEPDVVTRVTTRPVKPRRFRWRVAVVLVGGAVWLWKSQSNHPVSEPPATPKQEVVSAPEKQEPAPAPSAPKAVVKSAPKAVLPPVETVKAPPEPAAQTPTPTPPPAPATEPAARAEDDAGVPPPAAPNLPPAVMNAYNMGVELFRAGRVPAAIDAFSTAIRLKPDNAMAYAARAAAYTRQGKPDEAYKDISEAIRLNPRDPMALAARGNYYANQGQIDQALADLNTSLDMSPTALAYNRRGMIYLDRKDYAKAISDFTAAIQRQPDFLPAYRNRRAAEVATGDRAGAMADMQKIRRLNEGKKGGRR